MATKKQKYYVVWHGHQPGVYTSWSACQAQIKHFPNAQYKSYSSKTEAEEAFRHGPGPRTPRQFSAIKKTFSTDYIHESISVDAACSGNPGQMEYRGVWTADGTEIFHFGPVPVGTNNIGEFLALVHGLAWLQQNNDEKTPIYSDSKIAMGWVNRKKAATKLPRNANTMDLYKMIVRAENWLKTNTWKNRIIKWETEKWGEIPADFGRK